jgi:tRNA dimethylallyltransferase
MRRFPVIIGPTAGGKTALAVDVALALSSRGTPAEIITADAFQIYRGMDIGTAKPDLAERRGVPHHVIDLVDPGARFTLADWLNAAELKIGEIRSRGGIPIVVGGTHLYIKSLVEGMFEGPAGDEAIRERLRALPATELRSMLERVDPTAAARLHPNDIRRTIRALEVFELTGKPITEHQQQWDKAESVRTDCTLIGLDWSAEQLNPRINARVKDMMKRGLLEEVRSLHSKGLLNACEPPAVNQAREALGYKQLVRFLESPNISLEDAVERIKIETRQFGKAQRTWIKRLKFIKGGLWIDPASTPQESWCDLVLSHIGVA